MGRSSAATFGILIGLLVTSSADAQKSENLGSCSQGPPSAVVPVKLNQQNFLRLSYVDNDLRLVVNGKEVQTWKLRPGGAQNPPMMIPLNPLLNAGANQVILVGWNERSISATHAKANPWRFTYAVVAGPDAAHVVNYFPDVDCSGSDQRGDIDLNVLSHYIDLNAN